MWEDKFDGTFTQKLTEQPTIASRGGSFGGRAMEHETNKEGDQLCWPIKENQKLTSIPSPSLNLTKV